MAKDTDYTTSGQPTRSNIDELMKARKYGELELIKNMYESS